MEYSHTAKLTLSTDFLFFPQRDPLSHSNPPPRGGPPGRGSLARSSAHSSFAPETAFDASTWARVRVSTFTFDDPPLDVDAACVCRSSVAASLVPADAIAVSVHLRL